MRRINSPSSNSKNKKIAIASVIAVILAASIGWWAWAQSHKTTPATDPGSINYSKPTPDQTAAGSQAKQQVQSNSTSKSTGATGSDQPPAPTSTPGNTTQSVSVTITSANQNGSILQVRSLIGAVVSDGTCTLTLTSGSQSVTKTSGVQAAASTSSCQGFNVPVSELSPGVWTVVINFAGSNLAGTSASQKVTVQ